MTLTAVPTHRELLDQTLWSRLTNRIARDEDVSLAEAEDIMEEALAFLYECATGPEMVRTPSPKADIGWHTFILFTKDYHHFCYRVAGRFLHHEPIDSPIKAETCGPDQCSCDPGQCCNFS